MKSMQHPVHKLALKHYLGYTLSDIRSMLDKMRSIGDRFEKNSFYHRHWVKKRIVQHTLNPGA